LVVLVVAGHAESFEGVLIAPAVPDLPLPRPPPPPCVAKSDAGTVALAPNVYVARRCGVSANVSRGSTHEVD
jgi:hypothetical protein